MPFLISIKKPAVGSICGPHELSTVERIRRLRKGEAHYINEECQAFTEDAMRLRSARLVLADWRRGAQGRS